MGQEELGVLRRQLEGKDGEIRRIQDETCFKAVASSSPDPAERGGKSQNHGKSDPDVRLLFCRLKHSLSSEP